ncbi:MAG: hypothetical protein MR528_02080 [Lachnospiraceae bacterium]|nr:hypothetical protein [Lachnospiraceae bacterium]
MKKRLTAFGLALVMTASTLSGCSGSSGKTATTTAAAAQTEKAETTAQETAPSEPAEKIFYWSSTAAASNISPFEGNTEIVDYIHSNLYRYVPNETKDAAIVVPDLAAKGGTGNPGV